MAEWVVDRCGNLNARFENRPIMVLRAGARQGPAERRQSTGRGARRHARRARDRLSPRAGLSSLSLVHMCSLTDLELDLSLPLSARQLLFGMIAVGKRLYDFPHV